jgi:4-carboxymuconolactone decarboxylase
VAAEVRFTQLELEDLDEEQRRAIEPILAYAGENAIRGPFNASLRSPELTRLQFALGEHLLFHTTLPRRLVEMGILVAARVNFSQLEWVAHVERAREEGLSEDICAALREGRRPDGMDDAESALYDFSVELLTRPAVRDATFERAKGEFGERGIVELVHLLGFYGLVSLILKAAEVGAPDGSTPLQPLSDAFAPEEANR